MFSSCNPKFFAVKHIHYPVNPSSDHFHTYAVVPSSDRCRTETVLSPSDHYCIETVTPSGDQSCIDIAASSSDHCCTETVPPTSDHDGTMKLASSSDHLHTKITQQCKLIGEKSIHQKVGGGGCPLATPLQAIYASDIWWKSSIRANWNVVVVRLEHSHSFNDSLDNHSQSCQVEVVEFLESFP